MRDNNLYKFIRDKANGTVDTRCISPRQECRKLEFIEILPIPCTGCETRELNYERISRVNRTEL